MKATERASGILMHISSLPSKHGIGTLGQKAYEFVDFLSDSGQKYWQVLPIGPTAFGDSPYQSPSAFAGNPYFIDLDFLVSDGLLDGKKIKDVYGDTPIRSVDYGTLYHTREKIFENITEHFEDTPQFVEFCEASREWLDDYALFASIKEECGGKCWSDFENGLKYRDKDALNHAHERLSGKIRKHKILQFLFARQWFALKSYAALKGVKIIGDIPIYVAYDSCDVWCNADMFKLDGELYPTEVAGCPPDEFSPDGQLWGNPLYNWDNCEKRDKIYDWWKRRIALSKKLFDVVRIDHFRAFADYYSIPSHSETAGNGEWREGAGEGFFEYLKSELGELPIIAEDLGFLTDKVKKLLAATGFPGMKILQFGFGGDPDNEYLPHNYEKNCVVYLGTHDNATSKEWLETISPSAYEQARGYMRLYGEGDVWGMIAAAMASVADTAIFTVQDLLCLGKEGRMNTPSTNTGNWSFRVPDDYIWKISAPRLKALTEMYGR